MPGVAIWLDAEGAVRELRSPACPGIALVPLATPPFADSMALLS
jgi:hypothetical protein